MTRPSPRLPVQDPALCPITVVTQPGSAYASHMRLWQGIPGIERAPNGRLWATWYSGGVGEGPDNYVTLYTSGDDGQSWIGPKLAIDPPGQVRAFDPCLWHDPLGRLWLFWAQSDGPYDGRVGVWCVVSENANDENATWSAPRRIANGIMMNKPTVLSTGEWLAPTAVWQCHEPRLPELSQERYSSVTCSVDQGRTWRRVGGADVPSRQFDEHAIVERQDGTLWVLVRTTYGIGQSTSTDRGVTWSPGTPTDLGGPGSRFCIRRLRSGRLLLVNHHDYSGRNNLKAMLSDDDGKHWYGYLLLDDRDNVSYPDAVESDDGRIYVIYDRERHDAREILMAVFTEEDVAAGSPVTGQARMRCLVNKVVPVAQPIG